MDADPPFLPYARQLIEEDDIAAVVAVLRSDWLTTGPAVQDLEDQVCETVGADHAVACSNGTAALHLAAMALNLQPGDKVIVPSLTFLATANAATYLGAEVVFADCDPYDGLMHARHFAESLERAGSGVKAVFPVHLAGQCADLDTIYSLAREKDIAVVEDAAHAIGSRYRGPESPPRFIGDCPPFGMATFSFHPAKTLTMGEGGIVTTNDAGLAERARRFRCHGMVREPGGFENREMGFAQSGRPNPWYYEMPEPGFNYRATDLQCALGLSQLKKLGRFAEQRQRLVDCYDALLRRSNLPVRAISRTPACSPAWHLYAVLIDFAKIGVERGTVMQRLLDQGIGTQVHYIPVHRQPFYARLNPDLQLAGTDAYYERTLSLPLSSGMVEGDVARVVQALRVSLTQ